MNEAAAARDRRIGWSAALAVLAIWVGFQLVGRAAVASSLTPWDIGALRYAGAFLLALPLAWRFGLPRIAAGRFAAVMACAGLGFPLSAYLGFAFAPAAHGAVIMSAGLPVATTLLAWAVLGERPGGRRVASLAAVVAAALLLALDGPSSPPGAWIGDLFYAAASACWAAYTLMVRRWALPPLGTTLAIGLAGAPVFLPAWALALPSGLGGVGAGQIMFQMAYQGMLASILAGILYTTAVARLGPGPTTLVGALVPGLVALLAWPLLDEALGAAGMAGVVLAMVGMAAGVARARVDPHPPRT